MRHPRSYSLTVLRKIQACNFSSLDVGTLMGRHYSQMTSQSAKQFIKCVDRRPGTMSNGYRRLRRCVQIITNACLRYKFNIVRIVQFTMEQLEVLLQNDTNLKAIHLVRDPRGSLASQYFMGKFKKISLKRTVGAHCRTLTENLALSEKLALKFPNRILTVRYEDIAGNPLEATEFMYSYVGLNISDSIRKYVRSIMSAGKERNCTICTSRPNSIKTAFDWKYNLKYNQVETIQKQCSDILTKLSYRKITQSSYLGNKNFSTIKKDFFIGRQGLAMKPSALEIKAREKRHG